MLARRVERRGGEPRIKFLPLRAVRIELEGNLSRPTACQCQKCGKHCGHYEASLDIPRATLNVEGENAV